MCVCVLTDVAVLDVDDQLRQGVEMQPAASETARIREKGGSGDACHGGCNIERDGERKGSGT